MRLLDWLPWRRPNFPSPTDSIAPPVRRYVRREGGTPIGLVPAELPELLGTTQCLCAHWDPEHARGIGRCSRPGCGCLIMRPREDAVARN